MNPNYRKIYGISSGDTIRMHQVLGPVRRIDGLYRHSGHSGHFCIIKDPIMTAEQRIQAKIMNYMY